MKRILTREIHVGGVAVGGGSPIVVQSMCNTHVEDVDGTLAQIGRLRKAGCQIVRIALPCANALPSFRRVCAESPMPVVADIHFDHRLALEALEAGADGIRVNPGNMKNLDGMREVAKAASGACKAVRVGVNLGSLSPKAEAAYGRSARAMVESAREFLGLFEDAGCRDLKVSLKASSIETTVQACRLFREISEWPLHLGVTEAIHFDHRLALEALEAGADGIRVNPGNMKNLDGMREVAKAASGACKAVRVGVNLGSLSPKAEAAYGRSARAMVESAREFLGLFEDAGCRDLKVSLKASSIETTVQACRLFREISEWPLHLGVTEAGTPAAGIVKSAIGIGTLLLSGIGDTIRVSLTAPPEAEIAAAFRILDALGLRPGRPQLISCPTCGRTRIDLIGLAEKTEALLDRLLAEGYKIPFRRIAVMGCEVNGPGEAADADLGIAGGAGRGILFRNGKVVQTLPEDGLLDALERELLDAATPPDTTGDNG